jgi:CRISPR system Cascade subunit CasB
LGALILAADRDETRAETLRLRVAGNYYSAAHR